MIFFLKNKIIKFFFGASLLLNSLAWLLFYFRIPISVNPIVLRYNIYVGINLIGNWYTVFYFALVGLLIIILNFLLANFLYQKDKMLAYFLVIMAVVCQIILLIWGVLIIMING